MPTNLRNADAEVLLLEIRAARNAARQEVGDQPGAFLMFPTSVVIGDRTNGQAVYPLRSDAEPGAVVTVAGRSHVSGVVAGIAVTGSFGWTCADEEPEPAQYRFRRRGQDLAAPSWADLLPSSQRLFLSPPGDLVRQQGRLQRRGREAEHRLLALSEAVFRAACRGPIHRAIQYRPLLDVDDVVQRGLQVACRLLPLYTSPQRPPCSWGGMLRLDGRRDMHREVARLDGFSEEAVTALTLARDCGLTCRSDPAATMAELVAASARLGRSTPRIGASSLDAAMRAPAMLARVADASATVPGPETLKSERIHCRQGGEVVAAVARLISEDPELITAAVEGDPRALRRVGDGIVRGLRDGRESRSLVRHRCWEEFRITGQLLSGPAGLKRFGTSVDPDRLAAIDERLRQAVGVKTVAANR